MMALCLAREDAVEGWREMLGPKEVSVAAEQAPDRCSDSYTYCTYCDSDGSINNSYFCALCSCEVWKFYSKEIINR